MQDLICSFASIKFGAALQEAFDLLAKKVISVPAKKTFALTDAAEAVSESLKPGIGKVYISS